MRKLSNFALFIGLLLMFPVFAKAEMRFTIECDKTALERGESTTCTYRALGDAVSQPGVTEIDAIIRTTADMTIEGFAAANIWTNNSNVTAGSKEGNIILRSAEGVKTTNFDLGTVTVRLANDAVECGAICIEVSRYVQGGEVYDANRVCSDFEIVGEPQQQPNNPETGAFASYAVLAGGAALAVTTIAVVRSKNKFYRI